MNNQCGTCWLRMTEFLCQCLVDITTWHFPSRLECQLKECFVARPKLLQQQRQPFRSTSENRSARRFDEPLVRNVGIADVVVQRRRVRRLPVGEQSLRAQNAALGNGGTNFCRRIRKGQPQ
jgi:hypothetical protein